MMRTGTGRTKYGHKREGNTGHGEHRSDITPPPSRTVRPAPYTIRRGGGWALWRPQGTRRQDRRPPEWCPFRDPWRSGELGRPWWSRELRRPWRVRGLGRPWRIRELGRPWRILGLGRPWRDRLRGRGPSPRPPRLEPYYPPKKLPWGK